jgi:hypothetical protein
VVLLQDPSGIVCIPSQADAHPHQSCIHSTQSHAHSAVHFYCFAQFATNHIAAGGAAATAQLYGQRGVGSNLHLLKYGAERASLS